MGLKEKQLELQRATIDEFESKVKKQIEKKLKYGRQNIDDTFQKIYLKRLADRITKLRDKKLPKVIEKIFLDNRDEIVALYGEGELKESNLKRRAKEIAHIVQESINFKIPSKNIVAKRVYEILKDKNINLDKSIEELELKQKEQSFALGTIMLGSGEIAWLVFKSIGKLLEKDLSNEEDNSTSQQAIINTIAEEIFEHTAFRFKKESIKIEDWENTVELDIGETPFSILMELDVLEEFSKQDRYKHLRFSDDFLKNSKSIYNSMFRYIPPSYEPMIVPPTHWSSIDDGGFLRDRDSSPKYDIYIMKTTTKRDKFNLLKNADKFSPKLLEAINIIQDTKWRVNGSLLDDFQKHIKDTKEQNKTVLKELNRDIKAKNQEYRELRLVMKTKRETLEELKIDEDIIKEKLSIDSNTLYSIQTALQKLKSSRDKINGKMSIRERILDKAKRYSKYSEIYFVWQIDFRGRVYPIQPLLNPQGEDFAKALLHFATSKPLGERGEYWWKIHGANVYGEDKISFADRVSWVDTNRDNILSIFDHPNRFDSEFLKKADKPYSFLAFAYEYREFIQNPESFQSSIPIAMDGSNNGFQHITALLRDREGAKKVNVLQADTDTTPNDIYKDVADKTKELIAEDNTISIEGIEEIIPFITRDFTKKNVMTDVYGAGEKAKLNQNRDYIEDKLNDKLAWDNKVIEQVSKYISKQIDLAIDIELPSSKVYKNWMKKIVRDLSKQNRAIEWTTPIIELIVVQEEFVLKKERIVTKYNNKKRQIQLRVPTDKISQKEQTKGIAPNFIHSLDATHLFLTILLAKERGVDSFATIHDSFGTYACDIDILQKSIKDTFVEMFEYDILGKFREDIQNRYGIDVKKIKYVGSDEEFDIESIYQSDYFFS